MNTLMRFFLTAAVAIPVATQAITADIAIAVTTDLNGADTPGQTGQITVTLFNYGPQDTALPGSPGFSVSPVRATDGTLGNPPEINLAVDSSSTTTCQGAFINPGAPFSSDYAFVVSLSQQLAANSSATCVLNYQLNLDAGQRRLNFAAGSGNNQDTDPNPANNTVQVVFGIAPQTIPGLGWPGIFALMALMLFFLPRHSELFLARRG